MKIKNKHSLNKADKITLLRIIGTLALAGIKPFSALFFAVYTITGATDVLDGTIARKTHTESEFGARLDSIADLLFYAVVIFRIYPSFLGVLPKGIWYIATVVIVIRVFSYIVAVIKYRLFASMHTYLNKLTGIAVFLMPFILVTKYAAGFCWGISVLALLSALEELAIHLLSKAYCPNKKSILRN